MAESITNPKKADAAPCTPSNSTLRRIPGRNAQSSQGHIQRTLLALPAQGLGGLRFAFPTPRGVSAGRRLAGSQNFPEVCSKFPVTSIWVLRLGQSNGRGAQLSRMCQVSTSMRNCRSGDPCTNCMGRHGSRVYGGAAAVRCDECMDALVCARMGAGPIEWGSSGRVPVLGRNDGDRGTRACQPRYQHEVSHPDSCSFCEGLGRVRSRYQLSTVRTWCEYAPIACGRA
ncbi:hypothetical protein L226DRAFT_198164 [Lentinus tigrinus ALCF2SS1-7]|uniref:uncharacterized protein n=1 Tax=Lentinus tigrinus ALCF2SS1-7 TaxID=1328758 RepID=UPI001166061C|nr:hypothetical protein L226DRAFT_198164 [Lentinus tigrinus ALCF2SS1-7]